jgi:PAS domain S-box-containing protein
MHSTIVPKAANAHQKRKSSGEMQALIDAFDWSKTAVGPMRSWPETLKVAVRMMLASPVPMVMLMGERDGVMIYNDAYSVFAGKRHPGLLGAPVLEGWPEVADFNRVVMETGFRGETLSFRDQVLTLYRNDVPEMVWLDLNYSPVPDESGKPLAVLAIVVETTKRVSAERALERSEERLSFTLAASGVVGAWDWDIETDTLTADERFADMYGVDPAEAAAGASIGRFVGGVHPDDRGYLAGKIKAALKAGGEFRAEYRLQHGDGAVRWVMAMGRVIAGPDGRAFRLPGVVIDITERKKVEEALAASEAGFRVLADSMPQTVWSARPDGFHDYFNARWYEFTGAPEGSTDGDGWNNVLHPEDRERAAAGWRHCLRTGDPFQIEYRLRHHSGEYRWTLGRALPVRDPNGRISRWFGTSTDIHETKLVAEEREIVAQELSHRIKNIFSVLTGIISLSARSHPEIKPFTDQLRQRIYALGKAHDFVRPHTSASRPPAEQSSLRALIEQLVAPYRSIDASRVTVEGDDAVIDEGAATPLALLFHELATNAAKYGALAATGGRVVISGIEAGGVYRMVWKETGGKPIKAAPGEQGFGTRLIALSVEGQLGGTIARSWEEDGLRVSVSVPLTALNRSARLRKVAD